MKKITDRSEPSICHPALKQLALASLAGILATLVGLLVSATTYWPALQSAFKVESASMLGLEAFTNADILLPVILFLLATVFAHILFFMLPVLVQRTLPMDRELKNSLVVTLFLILLFLVALLYVNESLFSQSAANFIGFHGAGHSLRWIGIASLLFLACLGLFATLFWGRATARRYPRSSALVCALFIAAAGLAQQAELDEHHSKDAPNVFLFGLDSLRPDYALRRNQNAPSLEGLANFLQGATVFENATTVIGRSFPAWVSVFSGAYPHISGVRYNLQQRSATSDLSMLPDILREKGFTTIYATDETRFANIDRHLGFDHVITPGQGVEDFVVISFSDIPLVNVLANIPILDRAFGIVAMNRQAKSYMPETFLRLLTARLDSILSGVDGPVFLAVNFGAGHFPYHTNRWNWQALLDPSYTRSPPKGIAAKYSSALRAVDKQLASLTGYLTDRGLMNNSLAVLFSDHGENLGEGSEGYTNHTNSRIPFGMVGHGVSIFDDWTHQVTLAIKDMRKLNGGDQVRSDPVELVDVGPTLLSMLDIDFRDGSFSGHDLTKTVHPERYRLRESGVRLPSLMQPEIDEVAVAREAMENYIVTEDGRLEIRPDLHETILINKQRGLELDGVMLTYLDTSGEDGARRWTIVDQNRRAIYRLTNYPDQNLARRLKESFCRVYSKDPYFDAHEGDCPFDAK